MPPPPNLLGTMERVDNASCFQHQAKLEIPAEETRSLLQTIREQVVLDVGVEIASTGLELEAEHWQQKEAAAACRYTQVLDLQAQHAEEAVGQFCYDKIMSKHNHYFFLYNLHILSTHKTL
jgi:hypothetical protein